MNRAAQSLAWLGIALVTLGMALAFAAVITGGAGDGASNAQVDVVTSDGDATIASLPAPDNAPTAAPSGGSGPTGPAAPSADSTWSPTATYPGSGESDTRGLLAPDLGGLPVGQDGNTSTPPLTTARTGSLEERLLATTPSAGFVVFALKQPGWRMTALDAGGEGDSAYVTLAYENGGDYINLSQSPSGARPSLANASPVELRGLTGEIYEMEPVLLLRWDERGTGLLFSTDLSRERALGLAGRLEPLP